LKRGDEVILSTTKLLKDEIRGMRGIILEFDKPINGMRIRVIEGKSKGLVVWLPMNFFELIDKNAPERVVFT